MPSRKGKALPRLSHLDEHGKAIMVDVSDKAETDREAIATATVRMKPEALHSILEKRIPKGDVFSAARIAGIFAAKKTSSLIPLCHPLTINSVHLDFVPDESTSLIKIVSRVTSTGKTGVEMEALTAVSIAALTIYDMCKSLDKGMIITDVFLMKKAGGKSGIYEHPCRSAP